jgi:hypothetical protein
MRIAAKSAYLVAADAVRRGALFVTGRARQDVASRFSTVTAVVTRRRTDPAWRMRVAPQDAISAHPARHVARIARFRGVAAQAARRLRLRFDGVARDEIATVDEVSIDTLGLAALDGEILRHVVTIVALRLRVTSLTQAFLLLGKLAVTAREALVVPQESLRQRAA